MWKQKLHLEPPKGWLNDPNGLCYFKGKYHVYFQYAPDSAKGEGKKCWGHFESPDMLTWTFTGTVLVPDIPEDKDGVYSGSAYVNGEQIELFYTGNVKEEGNFDYITAGREANVIHVTTKDGCVMSQKQVILRNIDYPSYCSCHVRDPKVWQENGIYKMVLGARTLEEKGVVLFYESQDLSHWKPVETISVQNFGYMWECPDCFVVDGHRYLSISPQGLPQEEYRYQNVYASGYFQYDNDILTEFEEWDYGFDFYAPQTFQAPDGRRILIGWMGIGDIPYSNPTVDLGWQHCLTLPREITRTARGELLQNPVAELKKLRGEKKIVPEKKQTGMSLPFELVAEVNGKFEIEFADILKLTYDTKQVILTFLDEHAGGGRTVRKVKLESCRKIQLFADMSSVEIYLDGGRKVISTRFYPKGQSVNLLLRGLEAEVYSLGEMEVKIDGE